MTDFQGEWDAKGSDLDQRYARFCREPLSDDEVMWLGMADMVMPSGSVGFQLFITSRSGCDSYLADISAWSDMVADVIAKAKFKAKGGTRHRAYVEGYDKRWGRVAARDGVALAMWGTAGIPGINDRAKQFGCGSQGYQRIRDYVGGEAIVAIQEYKFALLWAMGRMRDTGYDARYSALTRMQMDEHDSIGGMGAERPPVDTGTASAAHE